jgi:hypothetical protein
MATGWLFPRKKPPFLEPASPCKRKNEWANCHPGIAESRKQIIMAGQLSRKDHALVKQLRQADVLQDVEEGRLDQRNGVILVACADGDRFPDVFRYQCKMQAGYRPAPRVHTLAWHGGAIACAPCSPVNKGKYAEEVFLKQITAARELKDIDVVALYAHAPCSAAAKNNVPLTTVIALQLRAKAKIKAMNPGIDVACFFHVDYGDGVQRTYFLCHAQWEAWAKANNIEPMN